MEPAALAQHANGTSHRNLKAKQLGHQEAPKGGRKEGTYLRTREELAWALCGPKLWITWQLNCSALGFNKLGEVPWEMLPRLFAAPDVQHCLQTWPGFTDCALHNTDLASWGHVWSAGKRVSQE